MVQPAGGWGPGAASAERPGDRDVGMGGRDPGTRAGDTQLGGTETERWGDREAEQLGNRLAKSGKRYRAGEAKTERWGHRDTRPEVERCSPDIQPPGPRDGQAPAKH